MKKKLTTSLGDIFADLYFEGDMGRAAWVGEGRSRFATLEFPSGSIRCRGVASKMGSWAVVEDEIEAHPDDAASADERVAIAFAVATAMDLAFSDTSDDVLDARDSNQRRQVEALKEQRRALRVNIAALTERIRRLEKD